LQDEASQAKDRSFYFIPHFAVHCRFQRVRKLCKPFLLLVRMRALLRNVSDALPESMKLSRRQMLAEELKTIKSTSDPELITAAQSLLALIKALPQGEKHIQVAQGTGIAQADRGSTATVTMHAPPRKDD
jgi:hypothetical protein